MVLPHEAIVIGGSWGGLEAILRLITGLPAHFSLPLVVVLHRGRNFKSELAAVLGHRTKLRVKEIEEKEEIIKGCLYLAPANYHVLIEEDRTFSLDLSLPVHHSRPSIDVTFESAAEVYRNKLIGILLTGANQDGAVGLKVAADQGGLTIVQNPAEAEADVMPQSAIDLYPFHRILRLTEIEAFLQQLK